MKTPSRRTASLLAVFALAAASTLGATASASAASAPLCTSKTGCESPDSSGPGTDSKPSTPSAPDIPKVTPNDPVSPGPSEEPTPADGPTDSPSPEPTESGIPTEEPTEEPTEAPSEEPTEEPTEPVEAEKDDDAPIFTQTPAAMGSESLSFTGLSGLAIVDVPTADGGSIRTLKISADSITISGFSLTVSPPDQPEGGGLVTKAGTMTLKGDVNVYLGSITATTKDGSSLTLGTDTPPPLDDVEPGLLRVTMGLVGTTADSIEYSNTDQAIVEP